jgi:hypothetical protein
MTEPVKKKVTLLKLLQISELVMDSDSDESDNGDYKTVGEQDHCEEHGGDLPLLQENQALWHTTDYTGCLCTDTSAEMPHSPIRPSVYEEEDDIHDQNGPHQHTLRQSATSRQTLFSHPRSSIVHNHTGGPR